MRGAELHSKDTRLFGQLIALRLELQGQTLANKKPPVPLLVFLSQPRGSLFDPERCSCSSRTLCTVILLSMRTTAVALPTPSAHHHLAPPPRTTSAHHLPAPPRRSTSPHPLPTPSLGTHGTSHSCPRVVYHGIPYHGILADRCGPMMTPSLVPRPVSVVIATSHHSGWAGNNSCLFSPLPLQLK